MRATVRVYTVEELQPLITTLKQIEELLDKWRRGESLSSKQQQAAWLAIDRIVQAKATQHYGMRQHTGARIATRTRQWYELGCHNEEQLRNQTTHIERCIELGSFLKRRTDKSVPWCVVAWKRRFAQFEAKLELRRWGLGETASEQSQAVNDLVKMKRLFREYPGFDPKHLVAKAMELWPRRFKTEEVAMNVVGRHIRYYTMIQMLSLDAPRGSPLED